MNGIENDEELYCRSCGRRMFRVGGPSGIWQCPYGGEGDCTKYWANKDHEDKMKADDRIVDGMHYELNAISKNIHLYWGTRQIRGSKPINEEIAVQYRQMAHWCLAMAEHWEKVNPGKWDYSPKKFSDSK